jgi:hypothetical protein
VEQAQQILESIGLKSQRLQMVNVSAAMAGEFSFAAAELTAEIRRLGPSPLNPNGASAEIRAEGLETAGTDQTDDVTVE